MADSDKFEDVMSENNPSDGPEAANAELQKLQEERDGLYDRLLRKQAEFDNFKKRVERERADYLQFASADLIRELLNALDSFELAIRNASSDSAARVKRPSPGRSGWFRSETTTGKPSPKADQIVATLASVVKATTASGWNAFSAARSRVTRRTLVSTRDATPRLRLRASILRSATRLSSA